MADPALRVKVRWASGTVGLLPSDAFSSSRCLLRGRLPFFHTFAVAQRPFRPPRLGAASANFLPHNAATLGRGRGSVGVRDGPM